MFDCLDVQEVRAMRGRLVEGYDGSGVDDAERIDLIRALEELTCAADALKAEVAADLGAGQQDARVAGSRGVAAQVALARRESPHRGQRHLGLARVLREELPCTRAAFRAGRITEWRAMVIAQETACLSLEDRRAVDRAIAGDPEALESYSDRVLLGELRKLAARLDPAAVARRRRRAETERTVTVRPAPDTMAYLTVLLPVAQAVAAYAALSAEADSRRAGGDPRSRGQVMADTLVARVTGAPTAAGRPVVPVSIGLVMTDRALLAGQDDPALISGHGPIPADLARELLADHLDTGTQTWLRRLYASPESGELVAMDSRARRFRGQLREFLDLRDQFCRTPWCNARIRHRDHITAVTDGGQTTGTDGQGLCEACNYTKQTPGWRARPRPSPRHLVETTTPTGHRYHSTPPPLAALRVGAFQQVAAGRWVLIA